MDIYVKPADNKDNNNSSLTKPFYVIGIVLLALVLLAFAGVTIPRLFGIQEYAVKSGSMEPELPESSLVFAAKANAQDLIPGDIIAYVPENDPDTVAFLRVTENDIDSKEVLAKGDAAGFQDIVPVKYDQIKGKVTFHIPLIGMLFKFEKNKWF